MRKLTLALFLLRLTVSSQSCMDLSKAGVALKYMPYTTSNHYNTIPHNVRQYYLCGPNSLVLDTMHNLETVSADSIYVSSGATLYIRDQPKRGKPKVFVKNGGILGILKYSDTIYVYTETGSSITDVSGNAIITTTTCIIFPNVDCNSLGLNDEGVTKRSVILFPNPASDQLFLKFPEQNRRPQFAAIAIYNSLGEFVAPVKANYTDEGACIDIRNLAKGIYFLRVLNDDPNAKKEKFVIDR